MSNQQTPPAQIAAVLVAAGVGARASSSGDAGLPKQYRKISGRSAAERALDALAGHPRIGRVVCVIRSEHASLYEACAAALSPKRRAKLAPPAIGGAERADSVAAALDALAAAAAPPGLVLIHDAARPFLPAAVVDRLLQACEQPDVDGACAALALTDTLRRGDQGLCGEIVPRDGLWRAQTPQAFRFDALRAANAAGFAQGATDDAEIARRAGLRVALVEGAAGLHKITTPADFDWAERWAALEEAEMPAATWETRVGTGFDVHAFGANADGSSDHVMLCGVAVPHSDGLKGHSDADVGLHALTDALLGALSLGDIGRHFPPSEAEWAGASSDRFLAHAAELVRGEGARIAQLDVTLICERPKIGPFAPQMRARIADIVRISEDRVSVKATTTERLGFTGRGEGVAALASASVLAPFDGEG